ncbi:spore germination protein [Paenibacillus sp. TRM 82003]|nr:spore germination protein [Paenibacillus sp. TRM 82003]
MKPFGYGEREIGTRDMVMTVSSMTVGIGVLTLPRTVTSEVNSPDGWISILVAGALAVAFAWIAGRAAQEAGRDGALALGARVFSRPISYLVGGIYALAFLLFAAYEVRAIAVISKQYLFEKTPLEMIALAFLLVVVTGVFGSRVGIIRLNSLFLPIVITVGFIVLVFTLGFFEFSNLRPVFTSGFGDLAAGARESIFSLLGFDVILFYGMFMSRPKDAPKAAAIGVALPILFYLLIFIVTTGVFSYQGAKQMLYPTIELAKEVQIPGEFFERFESLFFTVWIMTVFNTTCMALDIAVSLAESIGKRWKRQTWIFVLTPIVYLISMMPRNIVEFRQLGSLVSYLSSALAVSVPLLLIAAAALRRKGDRHAS